jgi:hypothetical protein
MTTTLADHSPTLHRQAYPPFADNSLSIGHTPLVRLNRTSYWRGDLSTAMFEGIFTEQGLVP